MCSRLYEIQNNSLISSLSRKYISSWEDGFSNKIIILSQMSRHLTPNANSSLRCGARRWCRRHIAKRDAPVLVLNLFCHQKTIRKAYVKKFSVLVYLTEGYESIRNKIDHLCSLQNFFTDRSMLWNYIGNGEKQVWHHLYRGHHMSRLSLVYL